MSEVSIEEKYRQQYAHFGRMNEILYRLPILFSTLIGGLWYFGFQAFEVNKLVSTFVFSFTAILSVVFILMMHRFGLAFSAYINNLNLLDGEFSISIKHSSCPSSIKLVQLSLVIASIISAIFSLSVICAKVA